MLMDICKIKGQCKELHGEIKYWPTSADVRGYNCMHILFLSEYWGSSLHAGSANVDLGLCVDPIPTRYSFYARKFWSSVACVGLIGGIILQVALVIHHTI